MFLEIKNNKKQGKGWVEVVCGSMFSGKTEELIRRLRRAQIAKMKVEIFKPAMDIRYDENDIVSHSDISIPSTPVENAQQILLMTSDVDVVGIDEVQFFDSEIVNVCNQLANKGTRVIVAGLDMDFQGKPFGVMPQLMAIAEYVSKVHAICVECGDLANFSHRLVDNEKIVMLGEKESYQPLCRKCFNEKNSDLGEL